MAKDIVVGVLVEEVFKKLPEICAARLPQDNSPILIKRGFKGYWPAPSSAFDVVKYNTRHGITAPQVEAMLTGSMFGWAIPGANPDNCDGAITAGCVKAPVPVDG